MLTEKPGQVLVLVLQQDVNRQEILKVITQRLGKTLPEGMYLDVWAMTEEDDLLPTVQEADCRIV